MSEPTPPPLPEWATVEDVYDTLGKMGPKVKDADDAGRFDTASQLQAARAEAYNRLERVYGPGRVPDPGAGTAGLEVIRWAVARLAAANTLDILRAALPDVSELPERLRRSAWDALGAGLPGFPPGGGPGNPTSNAPWASSGGVSLFPDPYAAHPLPYGYGHRDGATNTWTL